MIEGTFEKAYAFSMSVVMTATALVLSSSSSSIDLVLPEVGGVPRRGDCPESEFNIIIKVQAFFSKAKTTLLLTLSA